MAGNFFSGTFFGGGFFGAISSDTNATGGKGDNKRGIFKPTGLLHLPKKEGRKTVEDRVDESASLQAEIAAKVAREFEGENALLQAQQQRAVAELTQAEIDFEIGLLLKKKLRTQEDDLLLMVLMIAAS